MERLTMTEYWQRPGPCSPDGNTLAFVEYHPDTSHDIILLDLQSRRVTPFLNSRYTERSPELSLDGGWIAYSSDQSGRDEVYVRSLSGTGSSYQISSEGGKEPLWARNGKQLFYRWGNQVWVVAVRKDKGFSSGKPLLLFEKPGLVTADPIRHWDLSLDGQRFLMVKQDDRKPEPSTEMMFVQNWFEELKRLVPAGKK
jgi:serine/threonine-protein kinase